MLKKLGYQADVAANGFEVLEALSNNTYDVILMDIMMPELDGVQTTERIVEKYAPEHRPCIIALTANAKHEDRERYLEEGMNGYLSKPLLLNDLAEAIRRCKLGNHCSQNPNQNKQEAVSSDVLEKLYTMIGENNPAFVKSLVLEFIDHAGLLVRKIRKAADQHDQWTLIQASHTLKSSSAMFGALDISDTCHELEQMANANLLDEVAPRVVFLESIFPHVEEELRAFAI